jgi:hypothetical protein
MSGGVYARVNVEPWEQQMEGYAVHVDKEVLACASLLCFRGTEV